MSDKQAELEGQRNKQEIQEIIEPKHIKTKQ